MSKGNKETLLEGIGVSPGICIGRAYLVDTEGVHVVEKYYIPDSQTQSEKNRFLGAAKKATDELNEIIQNTPEDLREHAHILETHVELLKDRMLSGKTLEIIENDRINAEWALKKVVSRLKATFRDMPDPYFKDRGADIVHVSDRIMRNLSGADTLDIKNIDKRVILVAIDLSPAETSQIKTERIMGFVTDLGGRTSHTGIIARSLDIPAVLGVGDATRAIKNDDMLIVDGSSGVVIIKPEETTIDRYVKKRVDYEIRRASIARASKLEARTPDGLSIKIMGNIEMPEELEAVIENGGDGIGLYRTEFQYLSRARFPDESDLFENYKKVVEIMAPKPVTIRTLDINGDKAMKYLTDTEEPNPALGLRAIRYCLRKPSVFRIQLRAILRAAAFGNVRLLIPMISGVAEIRETRKLLDEAAESLEKDGLEFNRDLKLGIMIEVPSTVLIGDIFAKEVDFFSIGTNDLIQYTLAIDRGNRQVAHLYNPLHPAILRMIKMASDHAKENGIEIYMCGEMAGDPLYTPILLGLKMDELSMNPQSIPAVKCMVRSLNIGELEEFTAKIFKEATTAGVMEMVKSTFGELLDESLSQLEAPDE